MDPASDAPPSARASAHPFECLAYILDATCFAGHLAETIADVLERACLSCGVGWTHAVGKKRSPSLIRARKAAAQALKSIDLGNGKRLANTEIGLILGGKDSTTVLYYLGGLGRQAVAS